MTKVLVVDDDEGVCAVLQRRLERSGMRTVAAGGGTQGLKAIKSERFDAVVLDVLMPEIDGIELLTAVKAEQPSAYVVVMSGGGRIKAEQYLHLASMLGADAVFQKPLLFERLLLSLREGTREAVL